MAIASFHEPTARPTISLAGARAAYFGPGLDLAPHRNAAATIAVAMGAPFSLALDGGAYTTISAALIPPGVRHHLRAGGAMAFLYLDALSDDHARIRESDLRAGRARLLAGPLTADAAFAALGAPTRRFSDPRIAGVIRRIDAAPQDFPRLADAAALAALSPSRFHDLFRQAVGMPFSRYRLWRRMALVVRALSRGETLTTAAHDAGFASSAHLSTTFRTMFGLKPSELLRLGVRIEIGG